jgi:hypothetical protein
MALELSASTLVVDTDDEQCPNTDSNPRYKLSAFPSGKVAIRKKGGGFWQNLTTPLHSLPHTISLYGCNRYFGGEVSMHSL